MTIAYQWLESCGPEETQLRPLSFKTSSAKILHQEFSSSSSSSPSQFAVPSVVSRSHKRAIPAAVFSVELVIHSKAPIIRPENTQMGISEGMNAEETLV